MSWSQEISQLVTEVDQLTSSVNVKQTALDASVAAAELNKTLAANNAVAAANSAAAALSSFQIAEGHKNTAVGVYGSLAAQQTALINSQNALSNASFAAGSASSIQQQNLSGINAAALHRSPNAITSMFIYDTSKDSDGGAWTEKCQHTSWWNESLNGKWLGAWSSETLARYAGATLGAELVTNGDFSNGTTGWTGYNGATLSVSSGELVITGTATDNPFASQGITTISGRVYRITATAKRGTFTNAQLQVGTAASGGATGFNLLNLSTTATQHTFDAVFTATSATSFINLQTWTNDNGVAYWDNVSVREVTTLTTASGDYYQSSADGRFYRLWKNLLRATDDLTLASWPKGNATITSGQADPNGGLTAFKLTENTANSSHIISCEGNVALLGQFYAASIFVKADGRTKFRVQVQTTNPSTATQYEFDLVAVTATRTFGSWAGDGAVITPVAGAIGWFRCTLYGQVPSAGSAVNYIIQLSNGANSYIGDGVSGIIIWRPQMELGAVATTYEAVPASSEVFRGNKRDFPRLAGIVAEASSVTIYDLTEPGRPMWCRWIASAFGNVSSVSAMQGRVLVGCVNGLVTLDHAGDNGRFQQSGNDRIFALTGRSAQTLISRQPQVYIVNSTVNAVAMTVLPDAPLDPVTGLRVPTIAVATSGGASVIRHTGSVETKAYFSAVCRSVVFDSAYLLVGGVGPNSFNGAWVWDLRDGAVQDYGRYFGAVVVSLNNNFDPQQVRRFGDEYAAIQGAGLNLLRQNKSASTRALLTRIAPTHNTGWMTGDIRRCFLSDAEVPAQSGAELLSNGGFDTDSGWTKGGTGVSWSSGRYTIADVAGADSFISQQIVSTKAGRTYRLTLDVVSNTTSSGTAGFRAVLGSGAGSTTPAVAWLDALTGIVTLDIPCTVDNAWLVLHVSQTDRQVVLESASLVEVVPDRSYKGKTALITGTLTRAQLASGTSLVGYSGFSTANYLREPYSADLDFGTGEWSTSAWVNIPINPELNGNIMSNSNVFNSGWAQDGVIVTPAYETAGGRVYSRLRQPTVTTGNNRLYRFTPTTSLNNVNISIYVRKVPGSTDKLVITPVGAWGSSTAVIYNPVTQTVTGASSATVEIIDADTVRLSFVVSKRAAEGSAYLNMLVINTTDGFFGGDTGGVLVSNFQITIGSTLKNYQDTGATITPIIHPLFDRKSSSGSYISLGLNQFGFLTTEVFDGTTARTVTASTAHNTATWLKAGANYTTDGSLAILVNGREIAVARGTPLLTLNNSNAVLTIGNSFALDAPFPGSIALLKLGATVPTPEQETFIYEQEKQLFRANAASVLPDSNPIVDMSYDDATDRWVALSSTNESYWTGLVRNSVTPVPAGSYSRVATTSGIELTARTTTNPGVDITIPEYILREELLKRTEPQTKLNRQVAIYDYVGGFTATTTNGSTALTSVASLTYPASYIGARISGTGIPANTFITGVSGTTIYISAAASASASGVAISFLDFELPVGMTAESVSSGGTTRREGSTQDYTRLYDGFVETIRFATAPGSTTWVQIKASRLVP